MTVRVTASEVKEIIQTTIEDSVLESNHIATASLMVDEHLLDIGLSAPMLARIELYLAAHFVALTEERGGLTRERLGDGDESLANVYSSGLNSTRYGQTALSLDSTGTLTQVAQTTLKAKFRIV